MLCDPIACFKSHHLFHTKLWLSIDARCLSAASHSSTFMATVLILSLVSLLGQFLKNIPTPGSTLPSLSASSKSIPFLIFLLPMHLYFSVSHPVLPGSYEVFLLFTRTRCVGLIIEMISWSRLPRCPVVAFVAAHVPVQYESNNTQRHQHGKYDR